MTNPSHRERIVHFFENAYAAQRMFLGDTNRSGVPTKDAWKEYGANLDGIVRDALAWERRLGL